MTSSVHAPKGLRRHVHGSLCRSSTPPTRAWSACWNDLEFLTTSITPGIYYIIAFQLYLHVRTALPGARRLVDCLCFDDAPQHYRALLASTRAYTRGYRILTQLVATTCYYCHEPKMVSVARKPTQGQSFTVACDESTKINATHMRRSLGSTTHSQRTIRDETGGGPRDCGDISGKTGRHLPLEKTKTNRQSNKAAATGQKKRPDVQNRRQ